MANDRRLSRIEARHLREDRNNRANGLRHLLSAAAGRHYLWCLLGDCGTFQQPHSGNALATSFACGMLSVGQRLLAEINEADPDAFLVMYKENMDAQRARTAELLAAAGDGADPDADPE